MINIKNIKVAIVHDAFVEDGGAEKVVIKLFDMFPRADLYTSLVNSKSSTFKKLKGRLVKSFLNTKFVNYNPSYLKPLINIYWQSLDFTNYDLVITSSASFSSKNVLTSPGTLHVCYCHTPPKFLYQEFSETNSRWKVIEAIKKIVYFFMRQGDFIAAQRPDFIVSNSKTVSGRISKYYRRNSVVIYPHVELPAKKTKKNRKIKDYYIFVGRLYKQKGVYLLIDSFNKSGKKLVVVGEGSEYNKLKLMSNSNITFKGYVSDEQKNRLLSEAKALIFPSIDEDFGIVPVEAMLLGVPVIAYYSGGTRETVIDGKTGVFFQKFNSNSLNRAIIKFERSKIDSMSCYRHAKKFIGNKFEVNMMKIFKKNTKLQS